LARSNSFAVGANRGVELFAVDEGYATSTLVRVVESGIDADSKLRKAVCRRCGRRVRLVFAPVYESSSGRVRTWRVI